MHHILLWDEKVLYATVNVLSDSLRAHQFLGKINPSKYISMASLLNRVRIKGGHTYEAWVQSLGWEDPLEEGMATHSSILAWKISMDRGASWATVHGVTKSQTQLSDSYLHTHTHTHTHTHAHTNPQWIVVSPFLPLESLVSKVYDHWSHVVQVWYKLTPSRVLFTISYGVQGTARVQPQMCLALLLTIGGATTMCPVEFRKCINFLLHCF